MNIGKKKLLIVEGDDETYASMKSALEMRFSLSEIDVDVERAVTLQEAKRMLCRFRPHVVSTDMEFPLENKFDGYDEKAGAALVSHLRHRHRSVRCIMYSGVDGEILEERLCDASVNEFPANVSKSSIKGGVPMLLARIVADMLNH